MVGYWKEQGGAVSMDTNGIDSGKEKRMGEQMEKVPDAPGQSGKKPAGSIALIVFLAAFVLGFGAIGAGLCYSAHMREETCSGAAEGKVIKYRKNSSNRGRNRTYTPVVEYQVRNEIFTGETNASSSSRTFEIGEYVMIGYNPANPEEFYIKGYDLNISTRIGIVFLVISGGILAVLVIVLILGKSKISKEKKEKIEAGIIVGGIVFIIFSVFIAVAGLTFTLCAFGAMGLFALYGHFHNKRMDHK